jgi:ABC-type Zn uptake system ZnuABC Zn-binding protein ZnuA
MRVKLILLLSLPWLCLSLSCQRKEQSRNPVDAHRLKIVTTVAPITSIVENVVADNADVSGIIPEGVNSHTFEPAPSDSRLLSGAQLMILNGLDLEIPTLKLARANLPQGASIYSLGDKTITEAEYIYDSVFPRSRGIRIRTCG